ncbi:MAG: hypothetical protein JKY42_03245 [Flavobacteriales bacterium]|nr:hypothetical protein [Flavobacteriales bacterium]
MKRIAFFVFALAFVVITACNKEEETVSFEFSHDYEFTMTEDSISIDTTLALISTDIKSMLKEQSEQNNSLISLVQEVHLVSVVIEAVDPATQKLSFLQDAELFVTSGTLSELMVASKNPVSTTEGVSMSFDVEEGVDVIQYLKNTNFKFRVSFHLRNKLAQATKFKITGTFKAVAGVDK